MKYFRKILDDLDFNPLLAAIKEHDSWDVQKVWKISNSGAQVLYPDNLVLRRKSDAEPNALPRPLDRAKPSIRVLGAASDLMAIVLQTIACEHLGQIIITKLLPGEKIDWHIDKLPPGTKKPYYPGRYQIPLQVVPGVRFCVEDEECYMEPGTVWWFDNQRRHAVFNDSDHARISVYADIRPLTLEAP